MKEKETENTKANQFLVRLHNEDTLTQVEELMSLGNFKSKNELMNRCIELGVRELYQEIFKNIKKKIETEISDSIGVVSPTPLLEEIKKSVQEIKMTTDDLFVMNSIFEYLLASLFNMEKIKAEGGAVSSDMLDSGMLAELPKNLNDVKDEITRRYGR